MRAHSRGAAYHRQAFSNNPYKYRGIDGGMADRGPPPAAAVCSGRRSALRIDSQLCAVANILQVSGCASTIRTPAPQRLPLPFQIPPFQVPFPLASRR